MKQPPNSLTALLKQAETMFTNNKSSKLITLEDIEALAGFIEKGNKFLVDKVSNLVPITSNNKPNNKGNNSGYYNSIVTRNNDFVPSKQQVVHEPPLVISGDLQGTNFVTEASISLYDPTVDIEQQVNQSRDEQIEQSVDEVEVLNSIFESVEDAQE